MTPGIAALKAELHAADAALERATRALASRLVGDEMAIYEAAVERLLDVERRLAAAEGRPYAIPCVDAPVWDVGAPLPTLLQGDETALLFFLLPDDDDRVGRIAFDGLSATQFGAPNDETFAGHPLHGSGFEPYRAMQVIGSSWIRQLERINSVHRYHQPSRYAGLKHFVFPFHDTTFECVADGFTASTVPSRLVDAVRAAVASLY